ncbi:FAD-binding oxidoreductase [Shewanella eurypsychrophilus]|uniref:FAD-binding oxidoreductase n=1 Tax=Shewanella eurypsychrophilus TaxID=2593656 RepID=A0ABX6V664_9GAMM|nr:MULTISPECIES: FAD-binding oxidoreductase [Shewanella]QFU22824.1 FAD-dependent oxidoreductase [Shewanella sp. YLB-09]QPG58111.1 FAD-binding oxidoreductase [Shewanella eurypsychrophilus]
MTPNQACHSQFDPLVAETPEGLSWPNSYWANTLIEQPKVNTALKGNTQTDVAIIGGGYTGLLTAYYLASEFDIHATVLEANQIGFGASGRNAGFVLKGSGRLGYGHMAKRWDLHTAQGIYNEYTQAVARVSELIGEHNIDCEPQEKGYLKVAHTPKALNQLKQSALFIEEQLGGKAEIITVDQLSDKYMVNNQAYGALRLEDGFGINPLKLLLGYKQMVERLGVRIYENTCVNQWIEEEGKHRLITPGGEVVAKQVITAGNAYSPKTFNARIDNKFLPILSNIIVTEPLTAEQLVRTGLATHQVTMDTRILKYYYRLLPDNRLLFGGRGAIYGKDGANPKYGMRLKYALDQCFPALDKVSVAYNWTGWIAAALDDMPHVYHKGGVGYSLGYCGSGVSFSAQAAFRLAQGIAGRQVPNLPLYQQALPNFPMARIRRLGQWGYYHYGWLRDRYG